MPSTVAPHIHVSIFHDNSLREDTLRDTSARKSRATTSRRDHDSPVADLLPWADPYIAMLAARLEAQGREAQACGGGR